MSARGTTPGQRTGATEALTLAQWEQASVLATVNAEYRTGRYPFALGHGHLATSGLHPDDVTQFAALTGMRGLGADRTLYEMFRRLMWTRPDLTLRAAMGWALVAAYSGPTSSGHPASLMIPWSETAPSLGETGWLFCAANVTLAEADPALAPEGLDALAAVAAFRGHLLPLT